jgi:hypothetical protein
MPSGSGHPFAATTLTLAVPAARNGFGPGATDSSRIDGSADGSHRGGEQLITRGGRDIAEETVEPFAEETTQQISRAVVDEATAGAVQSSADDVGRSGADDAARAVVREIAEYAPPDSIQTM